MSKIALVDNDRNILTYVSMTLEAEGFEVETYNEGQSALDAFNRKLPDMAVLDIKMPRMDGMELLQALAQRPGFVKSRDQLMDVAYEDQIYVDDRTIDSHIKRLRKKMRTVDDDFTAIETLYGIGYRYNEE